MPFLSPRPRIILTIGDDGVVTTPYHIAGAAPFFTPADRKNGVSEIMGFVARHPTARLTLLADNLAQDYRSDNLPRLNIFDRAKLAQRRLRQSFPAARLTAVMKRAGSRHGILMVGLHDNNPVFAWSERLAARLPDIALLPVEGARLVARLIRDPANTPKARGWVMVISRHKAGGFRQIVTHDGAFVFTRLTPLPTSDARDALADIIARDIRASIDYLSRHGLRQAQDLSVLLMMPKNLHDSAAFAVLSLKSVTSLSPFLAARKLGLPFAPTPDGEESDLLFAASLIALRRAALRLRLPDIQQAWRTRTIKIWGLRTAIMAIVIGFLHIAGNGGSLVSTLIDVRQETVLLNHTLVALKQAQTQAAPLTEPLGRLRQAVERGRLYGQRTPVPWAMLTALGQGLSNAATLTKLEWKKESDLAPETLSASLLVPQLTSDQDRADTVAAFTHVTDTIAKIMPDYTLSVIRTPFPDMAQDMVTISNATADPVGEILLQGKTP